MAPIYIPILGPQIRGVGLRESVEGWGGSQFHRGNLGAHRPTWEVQGLPPGGARVRCPANKRASRLQWY